MSKRFLSKQLSPILEEVRSCGMESFSVKSILESIETIVENSQHQRAMKAVRTLSKAYLESTPNVAISPSRVLFSDETAFMGKFFSEFDGNPRVSCLTVLSLAGEMVTSHYILGGDDITEKAAEMSKEEDRARHHAPCTGIWFKSVLERIDGWGAEFDDPGSDPNVISPSVEVIEGDAESLYKCGGVSRPAMFSIPTYIQAQRRKSVELSSCPSNACLEMTDAITSICHQRYVFICSNLLSSCASYSSWYLGFLLVMLMCGSVW